MSLIAKQKRIKKIISFENKSILEASELWTSISDKENKKKKMYLLIQRFSSIKTQCSCLQIFIKNDMEEKDGNIESSCNIYKTTVINTK